MFDRLLRRSAALLDRFLPPRLRDAAGAEEAVRARTVIGMAFLAGAVFAALCLIRVFTARHGIALVDAVLAAAMISVPFVLRRTGRLRLMVNAALSLAVLAFTALPVLSLGGGLNLPEIGLTMVPLLAVLLVGLRAGLVWLVVCSAASATVGVLASQGWVAQRSVETLAAEHTGLVMAAVLLYVVGGLYEYRRNLTLRHIEGLEETRHRAERDRLEAVSEAKIAEAERLATLGEIAGMAAHEINNPLSYVANNLEFIAKKLKGSAELGPAIDDARDGVLRIQRIVEDLQRYGRPGEEELAVANVRVAVEAALATMEGHTRPRARVTLSVDEVPDVVASPGRLHQVLLSLILNAVQAIPEGRADGNTLGVRVYAERERVVIEIRDTGPPIPAALVGRVKQTLFSTKGERGSGLGLALSERILGRFGGELHVANDGAFAVAQVILFAVSSEQPTEHAAGLVPSNGPAPRRRILLVDDEPLVVRALSRHLSDHEVSTVTSGREALEVLRSGKSFDAILCDMMMPDLTGMDVYAFVREHRAELLGRMLFMTGGTFTERMREFRATVKNPFLRKPVDIAELKSILSGAAEPAT